MKYIKQISLIIVAVLVIACSVPLSSMAVDPVSAATMANAFAQAITAYGASQGVSMTFDVTNTDGIGEGVHDLWEQYAADMAQSNVTVSDYSNLSASVFPTLWKKTFDYVTVSLDAATVGEIDGFWNWLLSGPAEMTKVDNEYYEWTVNQNNTVDPIDIYNNTLLNINGNTLMSSPITVKQRGTNNYYVYYASGNSPLYGIVVFPLGANLSSSTGTLVLVSDSRSSGYVYDTYTNGVKTSTNSSTFSSAEQYSTVYFKQAIQSGFDTSNIAYEISSTDQSWYWKLTPVYGNPSDAVIDTDTDSIDVRPYIGDTAPQNVYIPDNTDVNYTPVAAEIPLDIPWNDELYGDGTGTLTDAQSEAITRAADDAITDNPDKTLELADTAPTPSVPDPSEVYIPFLPVTLPSFNFSLSGIWHYVTAWVASIGAWFSLVFTTWSYLPYAISVPVYATAVIVIVLGVYKRFFM